MVDFGQPIIPIDSAELDTVRYHQIELSEFYSWYLMWNIFIYFI